jgi:Cupin-like domain
MALRGRSINRFSARPTHPGVHQPVPTLPSWDLATFRERAFIPKLPALLPYDVSKQPPASQAWLETKSREKCSRSLRYDYLGRHGDAIVPLELTQTNKAGKDTFERFNAPLKLFLDWMKGQEAQNHHSFPRLYLAQCQISDLPVSLQGDLPTPDLVFKAGKGDVYGANIWIGLPPTYTPLHRDPNPNFFLQLAGTKNVRLFPPKLGREIFGAVQAKLGRDVNAAFRGEEMMQGEERILLETEVWGDGEPSLKLVPGLEGDGFEATVNEGNALFIPLGWWHSIKSVGTGTTTSVNWWFR